VNSPRAFIHVQHLLGVGHLRRAATLGLALADAGFCTTLASGGLPLPGLRVEGMRFIQLPPATTADASFKTLVDEARQPVSEAWRTQRSVALMHAWNEAPADVLIVELFPFGRRQLRFELIPLLEAARRHSPRVLVVCSVRDVLQSNAEPSRRTATIEYLERYFDLVLVHGDRNFIPFSATFPDADSVRTPIRHTGYLVDAPAPDTATASSAGRGEVIVSAGGGAVGARLLETALRARPLSRLSGVVWRILAGPNLPDADLAALRRLARDPGVILEPNRTDFRTLLANCSASISQAGYNTVIETLHAGARAVVVPFSGGKESEQALRAELLARRGLLEMVTEDALTPETLAAALDRTLTRTLPAQSLRLDGARRSVELIRDGLHALRT
jgi:predicted glycosyltransferase